MRRVEYLIDFNRKFNDIWMDPIKNVKIIIHHFWMLEKVDFTFYWENLFNLIILDVDQTHVTGI